MAAPVKITKGMEFRHASWLEADNKTQLLCRVTSVRNDQVYWKAVENGELVGLSYYFAAEEFGRYAKSE
jgi:hypothetical protein